MSRRIVCALGALVLAGQLGCSSAAATPVSTTPTPQEADSSSRRSSRDQDSIKAYADVITDKAVSDSGLFIVHWVDDELFFEIPNEMLDREMLLVSRVARTATSIGYGGQKVNTQTVRWQRHNKQILLRIVSYVNVADDSLAISAAVENANFEPILRSFGIRAFNEDSSAVVIEVTELYSTDVPVLGLQQSRRETYGVRRLDTDRSFVQSAKSFPQNIEVRSVLTYEATKAPSNASTGTVSLEMNHSMIMLPAAPLQPRFWDDPPGFFTLPPTAYAPDHHPPVPPPYLPRPRPHPTAPAPPPPVHHPHTSQPPEALKDYPHKVNGVEVGATGWHPFPYPFNLTGPPAATVPCGFTGDGLPIGLQIIGRRFEDLLVMQVAAKFEEARPWADKRPPV